MSAPDPTAIEETHRDRGLLRAVGVAGLAAVIANTVIGGGIFALPGAMAAAAGDRAPLAYVACAVAVGAVALCFAEAGSRVATSGGVYGYVEVAFGRYLGFVTAILVWLGGVLGAAGVSAALADLLARALPAFAEPGWRAAFIVVLIGTITAINLRGIRAGTGLSGVLLAAKLIPMAALLILGALHGGGQAAVAAPAPVEHDFGRAMILGVFAFMGMESALAVSGEVKTPARTVPPALLGAIAAIAGLYIAIQLVCAHLLGAGLAGSPTPLVDAARVVSPALAAVVTVGSGLSMLGYVAGDLISCPRILFALARDRLLPSPLAGLNSRRAPWIAIAANSALTLFLALSGAFAELAALATLVVVPAYILGSAAAVMLKRRSVVHEGAPMNLKGVSLAAGVGIAAMVWLSAQAKLGEVLATLAALVLASLLYLLSKLRRAA